MIKTRRIKVTLTSSLDSKLIYRWKELSKGDKINHSEVCEQLLDHYIKTDTVFPIATIYKDCEQNPGSPNYIYVFFKNPTVVDWLEAQKNSGVNLSNLLKTILFSSINMCDSKEDERVVSPIEISSALIRKVSLQNEPIGSSVSADYGSQSLGNQKPVHNIDSPAGDREQESNESETSDAVEDKHNLGISKEVLSNHLFSRMGSLSDDEM